jgi:ribonuclease P protein component
VARTAHFSLHVLPHKQRVSTEGDPPRDEMKGAKHVKDETLSTGDPELVSLLVDDSVESALVKWRLGLVLPKKQARRSVTRSLMRNQAREAFRRHVDRVFFGGAHGAEVDGWVLRLRAPFDRQQFPSAASVALNAAVRQELDELWLRVRGPRA